MTPDLNQIKSQKWFYEFDLPDGTKTESYLAEIARPVHLTRERALRRHLTALGQNYSSALDVACHEGFFSLVLAERFETVGFDKNAKSLSKARQISAFLERTNVRFEHSSLEQWRDEDGADFVLCFGLIYHVENPIQVLRKLATLTKQTLCIETQVLPFELDGAIEDGSYLSQRNLNGLFGLCTDYSDIAEGGLTDLALVPSRRALEFLLLQCGFREVAVYKPEPDDYEQFIRNQRVVVFAEK